MMCHVYCDAFFSAVSQKKSDNAKNDVKLGVTFGKFCYLIEGFH